MRKQNIQSSGLTPGSHTGARRQGATVRQCCMAFCAVLNVVGAFIAMNLRLPVYLDSIGTVMCSALLGPVNGALTGVVGSLISGFTFDVYSFYYAPVQIFTGIMAGMMFRTVWLKGWRLPIGAFIVSLHTSISSALVTTFVFGGITSAGSSYIVQIMTKLGVSLTAACFSVQIFTDYADEFIGILIAAAVIKVMPGDLLGKIRRVK